MTTNTIYPNKAKMLAQVFIIIYKLAFMTYIIMKSMVRVKYIGLVNLILGDDLGSKPIVQEFIQPDYNEEEQVMVE